MNIPPARAIGWTIICLCATVASSDIIFEFLLAISLLCSIMLSTKSYKPLKNFIFLSGPFFVPLVLIHTLINPQFEITNQIWLIHYRYEGLRFALQIYSSLSVYLTIAICWLHVNRDFMVDWLASRNTPFFLIGLVMQASAMVPIIEKRGKAVLKAQTARGIATGPSIFHRLKALPTILLPIITSLINEADHRSVALWSRGFGSYKFAAKKIPFGTISDMSWSISVLAFPAIICFLIPK